MSAHTKGPWYVSLSQRKSLCVVSFDTWICGELEADNDTSISLQEAEANARLIAAAPDLLEALKGMYHFACAANDDARKVAAIAAMLGAIDKAEGIS
jgi:hypothetical protein